MISLNLLLQNMILNNFKTNNGYHDYIIQLIIFSIITFFVENHKFIKNFIYININKK